MDRLDAAQTPIVIASDRARTSGSRSGGAPYRWLTASLCVAALLVLVRVLVSIMQLNADVAALRDALSVDGDTQTITAAMGRLEQARLTNADSPYLYRWLSRGYLALGRVEEAREAIEQAYRLDPNSLLTEYDLALTLEATDNFDTAFVLRDRSQPGADAVRYAEIAHAYGRFDEALIWYGRATSAGWELSGAIAYTQFEAARAMGDTDAAEHYLADAVARDIGWTSDRQRFDAMRSYGMWLVEQSRNTEAISLLTALSPTILGELSPTDQAETLRYLALVLWDDNHLPGALATMERAVALDPQSIWVQIHYGKVLFVNDPTRLPEVHTAFSTALDLSGHNPGFYRNLIEFWQWQRQPAEVQMLCETAVTHAATAELASLCP